jgi:hypothetical protein
VKAGLLILVMLSLLLAPAVSVAVVMSGAAGVAGAVASMVTVSEVLSALVLPAASASA